LTTLRRTTLSGRPFAWKNACLLLALNGHIEAGWRCPLSGVKRTFGINAAHNLGHFRSLVIEPRPARGPAGDLQEPSRFNPPETCCRVWDGQSYEHGATPFPSRRACRDRRRKRTGRGHYTFHPSRTPIPRSVSTSIC